MNSIKFNKKYVLYVMVIYVFVLGAVAVNLFMLNLLAFWLGLSVFPPVKVILVSVPLSIPATYFVLNWVDKMIREAEGK